MEPDLASPPPSPQQPVVAQVVPESFGRPPRRRFRILGPLLLITLLLVLAGSVLLNLGLLSLLPLLLERL